MSTALRDISPALLLSLDTPEYARRRVALGIPSPFPSTRTLGDLSPADELRTIRQNKLLDTAISGAVTGAGLNYWRRGARGIIPGATTATLFCTLLQYAANELSVQRIRYVANRPAPGSVASPLSQPAPPPPTSAFSTNLTKSAPKPLSQKIVDTISYVIPLTRLDDKEYLQRLEQKRDVLDGRIDRLQRELLSPPAKPS
ncbi:hypothetical protein RhiJN_12880 [Ceratobasidium sp. AG-Ba]|nr:hypothetical protein RhiJN_12880 [Ceratobasidium sp. AG-Ba]